VSQPDQDESIAASLAALARAAHERQIVDDAAGRARLLLRARSVAPAPRSSNLRWLAPAAAAFACALAVWALSPSKLRYQVTGASQTGSYVSAPVEHPVVVEFSDQTRVVLAQSSQLRVEETSQRGARILLERGAANVHVVHREHADWTFAAGPFDVHVTGTRFDLSWDPAPQIFELTLREGSVEIQSPLSPAPVALRAGQTFRGDLALHTATTAEVSALGGSAAPPSAPAPALAPPSPSISANANETADALPSSASSSAAAAPSLVAPVAPRSWSKLIAAGEFKALLEQANERGVPSCLRACSAADLSALADAARYTGQTAIAEQSLQALRARFGHEPAGRSAAFLLGRLREGQGAASDANVWYGRYLSETPDGAYAAEALAGRMRSVQKISGPALARPIAEEYLRRYPNGVHAGTARSILGTH
jgi:TolA-binding protein